MFGRTMDWTVFAVVMFVAISSTVARPNEYNSADLLANENGDFMNGGQIEYKANDEDQPLLLSRTGMGDSKENMNLLDSNQWKELLAQGKMRDMINIIQRALGSNTPVKMRTQWGGPDTKDVGNTVRNTVNWNAYKGGKTNLNVIMDSKFARNDGKVDMINPSVGINFQLKY